MLARILAALLLLCGSAAAQVPGGAAITQTPPPGVPAINTVGGVTTANLVCDGVTDNYALLNTLLTAASSSNGTIYIPPAKSACMFASNVTVPDGVDIIAWPGSVVLKMTAGNTSSPGILNFSGNLTTGNNIYGVTFDGGGNSGNNLNNVNTVFNSTNVVFDHVTVQNTTGIGIIFSTTVTNSGVRDSTFNNVGASYIASFNGTIVGTTLTVNSGLSGTIHAGQGLSGSGVTAGTTIVANISGGSTNGSTWTISPSQNVGPVSMNANVEKQGVAFCCGVGLDTGGAAPTFSSISGTTMTTANSVSGIVGQYVYGVSVAPDTKVVSGSGTSWTVSQSQTVTSQHLTTANNHGNFVKNSFFNNTALDSISYTQQHDFAAQGNNIVAPGIGGAGIYDHSNDTTAIVGNTVSGLPTNGNCIDLASTSHASVVGNTGKGCGGSGIAYAYASHATITGNVMVNNGQNGTTGEGTSVAGLFLTGTSAPVTNVTISGNDFSDAQSTPTQRYGIEMQTASTFSAITIDPNNTMVGNVVSALSSLLTGYPNTPGSATNDSAPAGSVGEILTNSQTVLGAPTVTLTIANPGVVTWTGHGFKCLSPVYFSTSGALPTGLTAFTAVYITCGASLTTNTFQVSTTEANALAGTSINFTGSQSGTQTGHGGIILTSGAASDVVGLQLNAGDYDCTGLIAPNYGGATSVTQMAAWLGTAGGSSIPYTIATPILTANTLGAGLNIWSSAAIVQPAMTLNTLPVRVSLASAGMVVLSTQATYTVSSTTMSGIVRCRRLR